MTNQPGPSGAALCSRLRLLVFAPALLCALTIITTHSAQTQTLTVLHTFSGGGDGASPFAGLTMDQAGNFYGTTAGGGFGFAGTVFKLSNQGSSSILTTLHTFAGPSDGDLSYAGLVFGPRAVRLRLLEGLTPTGTSWGFIPMLQAPDTVFCLMALTARSTTPEPSSLRQQV